MRHLTRELLLQAPVKACARRSSCAVSTRFALLLLPAMLATLSSPLFAQGATPPAPARETPRPQDLDPAVDTSRAGATSEAAPQSVAPRPQDIDPAVDTSRPGASKSAPAPAAATTAPGAQAAAGNTQAGGATRTEAKGKARALDRLDLDTTQITGNRELPKVLYIVPWKRADLGDLVGKPVNSLLDEVLTPVDRDVFKRETRYYRALTPDGTSMANKAASGQPSDAAGATSTPSPNPGNASGGAASSPRDER